MELDDIKKCPVCNKQNLKRNKTFIKCEDCNAKIGVTNDKLWYEYSVPVEKIIYDK